MVNQPQPPKTPKPRFQIPGWLLYVLMLLVTLWFITRVPAIMPNTTQSPPITIPYSFFRSEVEADQVSSVLMQGTLFTGVFKSQVTWPSAGSPEAQQNPPATSNTFSTMLPPVPDNDL